MQHCGHAARCGIDFFSIGEYVKTDSLGGQHRHGQRTRCGLLYEGLVFCSSGSYLRCCNLVPAVC